MMKMGEVMERLFSPPRPQGTPSNGGIYKKHQNRMALPGVKQQPNGDRKGGVVWHTQGSESLYLWYFIRVKLY